MHSKAEGRGPMKANIRLTLIARKTTMKSIGMDCEHCRTPLRNLSENEYSNLVKELEKAGLYELNGLT